MTTIKKIYWVYFVRSGANKSAPVKIGVTADLTKRLKALQPGNPFPLQCVGKIECLDRANAYELEAYIHRKLKRFRMQGEWFKAGYWDMKSVLQLFDKEKFVEHKIEKHFDSTLQQVEIVKLQDENKKLKNENRKLKQDIEEYLDSANNIQ